MIIKQTIGRGRREGFSLGKRLQGIKRPLLVVRSKERFGLGYEPTKKEILEIMFEKKKRMARLKRMELENMKIYFSYLYETFRLKGYIHPDLPKRKDHEYETVVNVVAKKQSEETP
ncbi:Uncharacterized protein TCM_043409 [Theobroma cacao]|uniref:Uncharacterized protein n=1 Tax=Theobroma cacao TaxID=3641 RepID=A0A061FNK4_THECC|nr:Uncharacterized protein TCM_043409 [Theobroma cacao]